MLQARQCEKSAGEAAPVRIKGQMLRLSEHREVAIYLRDGDVGIADFIDGRGELVDVVSWFRFNCGSPANAYVSHRMAIESAKPLSADLIGRIEALHRPIVTRRPRTLLGALKRLAALLARAPADDPRHRIAQQHQFR
jgi:hypothetical protein